jgi:hypothetical protein
MNRHFKISVIQTEYITDLEKKTVTCKIDYKIKTSDDRIKTVMDCFAKYVAGAKYIDEVYTASATAKLHPEDEFDQHKGEQVARAKVESLVYGNVSKYFYRVCEWYIENIDIPIIMFMDKSNDVIGHNEEYIESF